MSPHDEAREPREIGGAQILERQLARDVIAQELLDELDEGARDLDAVVGPSGLPRADRVVEHLGAREARRAAVARLGLRKEAPVDPENGADDVPAVDEGVFLRGRELGAHRLQAAEDDVRERLERVGHVLLADRMAPLRVPARLAPDLAHVVAVAHRGREDEVADGRVQEAHLLDREDALGAGREAAREHRVAHHLRRLEDAQAGAVLEVRRQAEHVDAVLHHVALGQARADEQHRRAEAVVVEELLAGVDERRIAPTGAAPRSSPRSRARAREDSRA